jgi:hypothetical protein
MDCAPERLPTVSATEPRNNVAAKVRAPVPVLIRNRVVNRKKVTTLELAGTHERKRAKAVPEMGMATHQGVHYP